MDTSLRIVIAGGSGSLGCALAADLTGRGHEVIILTRRTNPKIPFRQVEWDGQSQGSWVSELAVDPANTAVINLAGRLVDVRPTAANIADLRESRVRATNALVEASATLAEPLARWVQASTTAIWSDAGDQLITEETPIPSGADALAQMTGVAEPWEAAARDANTSHLTILRTSLVLQTDSPVMDRLTGVTRWGLGGRLGSGQQWVSWIHETDWLRIVRVALGLDPVTIPDGVLIAAAPHPVRNTEMMASLRSHMRRPAAPPTPAFAVKIGAVFMRTDPSLGLTGRHCTSALLDQAGFEFEYPNFDRALQDLLSAKP